MAPFSQKQWVLSHLVLLSALTLVMFQFLRMADAGLTLSFLDVGQGDAILIQTDAGRNILIDAGPDSAVVDQLGKTMGFFDKTIDLFIMTHPDKDHYAGILDVFGKYDVKRVMMTGVISDGVLYRMFLEELKTRAIPVTITTSDQDLWLGGSTYLDVLYPLPGQNWVGKTVKNKNDTSIVVRLMRSGESLAVLTGDTEFIEEKEILRSGQDVAGKILKLGHHGSKTSTSDEWLKAVAPTTAVVSAGRDNQYGHPHPETMERVKALAIRSTQKEGTVSLSF